MRVVYSGCRWNTMVFAMTNGQQEFENWLYQTWTSFQDMISRDPVRFKVGRNGALFTNFIVTPSTDPEIYPNELRCRLATRRMPNGEYTVLTSIQTLGGDLVESTDVWANSHVTPIFRLGYYKDGDEFGLQLTVLKALYEPSTQLQIDNADWMVDSTSNTSGSSSEMDVALENVGSGIVM